MSHTPGPWNTWIHRNRWRIDSPLPRGIYNEEGQRWLVAETLTDNPEDEANARLIAAAPDLLQALRDVLERIELAGGLKDPYYKEGAPWAIKRAKALVEKLQAQCNEGEKP